MDYEAKDETWLLIHNFLFCPFIIIYYLFILDYKLDLREYKFVYSLQKKKKKDYTLY